MDSTMNYPTSDPRIDKTMYMYFPFGGLSFLDQYRQVRLQTLGQMKIALEQCQQISPMGEAILAWHAGKQGAQSPEKRLAQPYTGDVHILEVLQDCTCVCLANMDCAERLKCNPFIVSKSKDLKDLVTVDLWCEVFIRKIEIAKRLFETYDEHLKPKSRQEVQLDQYALCALILAVRLCHLNPLRSLNGLLKFNDIFTCEQCRQTKWSDISAAAGQVALELEVKAVEQLAADQGVTWAGERACH